MNKSCSWTALLKFDFELTSDSKIQPAFTCRESNRFWPFSLSRVDHALRPISMFWLVKIWQVSSCGKFMQRLETCLLIVLFTWDVMRKSMSKRLVYTPPDSSPRFTGKVNLSKTKHQAWFFILASQRSATCKLAATKDYRGACVSWNYISRLSNYP